MAPMTRYMHGIYQKITVKNILCEFFFMHIRFELVPRAACMISGKYMVRESLSFKQTIIFVLNF